MQELTADAPALKAMAGISARGRKLKNPHTHLVLSWPEGVEAPPRREMLSAGADALDSIGLDDRRYVVCAATPTRPARTCTSPSAASTRKRAGPSTSTKAPPSA